MPKISEEKRRARQNQILDAATRCFARDGFHRTSMEDIVRESELSPGAIYCYFRGKHDIVEAISAQRHARDSALIADLISSPSLSEGIDRMARALAKMLRDPRERERRRVSIQFWAESLHDARIRSVAERGIRQRDHLTVFLRKAQEQGELSKNLDMDSLSRIMLALLQGLILQQAWEPRLNTGAYAKTASMLLNAALPKPNSPDSPRKGQSVFLRF